MVAYGFCPKILKVTGDIRKVISYSVNASSVMGTIRGGGDTKPSRLYLNSFELFAPNGSGDAKISAKDHSRRLTSLLTNEPRGDNFMTYFFFYKCLQWRIPEFPRGGVANTPGGANIRF